MPSRYTVMLIVAFWLGTSSWLFYHDLWPRLTPGVPPPFSIDLADEAQAQPILWVVNHNGRRTGRAYIKTEYLKDRDLFSIEGEFKLWFSSEMRGIADLTVET